MGYYTSNPVSVNGATRLSDMMAQHENAMELKRSFGRFHSFASSGGNDGVHGAIGYAFQKGSLILPAQNYQQPLFALKDQTYFDGAIWRGTLSVLMNLSGGSIGGHCVFYWAGDVPSGFFSYYALESEGTLGFNYKGAGVIASTWHLAKAEPAAQYASVHIVTAAGDTTLSVTLFGGSTGGYGVGEQASVDWYLQLMRLCPAP